MRAFLAIPADAGWAASAGALLARLRPGSPPASWTRPESWHITLKFLGEISPDSAVRFARKVGDAVANAPGGTLSSGGSLFLPSPARPRVLGIGFDAASSAMPALAELASAAERAFRKLGGDAESRAFRPHVTFARVRRPWSREAIENYRRAVDAWSLPPWPVRTSVLFESRLAPSGAVHTPLAEWTLAPAAAEMRA